MRRNFFRTFKVIIFDCKPLFRLYHLSVFPISHHYSMKFLTTLSIEQLEMWWTISEIIFYLLRKRCGHFDFRILFQLRPILAFFFFCYFFGHFLFAVNFDVHMMSIRETKIKKIKNILSRFKLTLLYAT